MNAFRSYIFAKPYTPYLYCSIYTVSKNEPPYYDDNFVKY